MNGSAELSSIDEYIALQPKEIHETLKRLREVIKKAAPKAVEAISYGMPAFQQNGNLVYFGVSKNHIGFYPTPSAIIAFRDELKDFSTSKGAVQFSKDKPLPYQLISEMVKFRVEENSDKEK